MVEVAFYAAVLPVGWVVARAGRRSSTPGWWPAWGCLAFGAWAMVLISYETTDPAWRILPPYLTSFDVGMLFAGAELDAADAWSRPLLSGVRRLAAHPLVCFGLAAGAFVALAVLLPAERTTPAVARGAERSTQSFVQVAVAGLAVLPLAMRTTTARWLERPVLVALGVASFGFYLWHVQVLRLVRPMLQGPDVVAYAGVALAIGVAYLAGEASRRWIEDPARRFLTRSHPGPARAGRGTPPPSGETRPER